MTAAAPSALSEKPKPHVTMLVTPNPYSKTGGNTLVLAWREYRSKWWTLQCFCKRARKNGTCQTLDGLTPFLTYPDRVRPSHEDRSAAA